MKPSRRADKIIKWIQTYAHKHQVETLVVGISGGIDSSVVSTLCAHTGIDTLAVSMPIRQSRATHALSVRHGDWLTKHFAWVEHETIDLTATFKSFEKSMGVPEAMQSPWDADHADRIAMSLANSRARLRMMCLYQLAQSRAGIVVGTGNKIEDFGVGFFTKYGDGGVDISPLGDCLKSQVWDMARELDILPEIQAAAPTDGLWDDQRTDQDQLGMTYAELELAMYQHEHKVKPGSAQERDALKRYRELRARNLHKMSPIPVCEF